MSHESEAPNVLYFLELIAAQSCLCRKQIPSLPAYLALKLPNYGTTPDYPKTDKPAHQFILILPAMDARRFFSELADVFAKGRPSMDTLNAFGKGSCEFLGPPISIKN